MTQSGAGGCGTTGSSVRRRRFLSHRNSPRPRSGRDTVWICAPSGAISHGCIAGRHTSLESSSRTSSQGARDAAWIGSQCSENGAIVDSSGSGPLAPRGDRHTIAVSVAKATRDSTTPKTRIPPPRTEEYVFIERFLATPPVPASTCAGPSPGAAPRVVTRIARSWPIVDPARARYVHGQMRARRASLLRVRKDRTTGPTPRLTQRAPVLRSTRTTAIMPAVPGEAPAADPNVALKLCGIGVDLFEEAQYDKAADAFAKAYQHAPTFAGFASNLGASLIAQRAAKEALEILKRGFEGGEADAPLLVNLGIAIGEDGDRQREIAQYQAALREEPDLKEAHLNLAIALMDSGQPDKAIEPARKAIALAPEWPEAHLTIGYAFGMLRRFKEEADAYRKALELKPGYPEALNNLGAVLRHMQAYAEAAEVFAMLVAAEPQSPQPLVDRAICLWFAGDAEGAQAAAEKAIGIQGGYLPALTTLGLFWAHRGDPEKARASTARAVELFPKSAEAHFALGIVHEMQNQHAEALAAYERAKELQPRATGVLLHRADTLAALGRRADAIDGYRDLIRIDNEIATAHANLGEALLADGKREEARESLVRAASLDQPDLVTLRRVSKLFVDADLPEKALEVLERLMELDPRDHESAHAMGQIHSKMKNYEKAIECYERAFRIDPTYAPASYNLATLQYTAQRYEVARKVLELTIKAQPDHVKALNLLAKTFYKMKDPKRALDYWEKALEQRPDSGTLLKNIVKVATECDDSERARKYYGRAMAVKAERDKRKGPGLSTTIVDDIDE